MRTKLSIVLLLVVCSTAWSQMSSSKWYIDNARGYRGFAGSLYMGDSNDNSLFFTLYDGLGVHISTPSEQDKWICSQILLREYTGISVGHVFRVYIYDHERGNDGRDYVIRITNARTLQYNFVVARYMSYRDTVTLFSRFLWR